MTNKPFYLTTTLPYVNADPHIGFALELVHADIQARHQRRQGREVFFTTGTDEHGQKILQKATEKGQDVQEYVDYYAAQFEKLKQGLNLSNDAFIRTTDPKHIEAAQELWRRCEQNVGPNGPDIYKKKYKGLYCVGDEMFVKEADLLDGRCPNHPNMDPVEIEEENYFFRLSRYQTPLLEYLSNPATTLPEWRRQEILKFTEQGLEDVSISREVARMSWGIPVPGDESQVMYVWFDALTNYISTLDWPNEEGNFKKFWVNGETVQMAGKDQVRFQSVMWQAMLMSAKLPQTQKVVYHGFITSGGQKMSKSLGNVIEPFAIVDEYGTDALRYFLARHISAFDDSDFTMEKFKEVYNADLANGLGNLVSRVMKMAEDHTEVTTNLDEMAGIFEPVEVHEAVESYTPSRALEFLWEHISRADECIAELQPFKLVKTDKEKAVTIINKLKAEVYSIACELEPFMPDTSKKIKESVAANKKPDTLFPRKE